MRARATATSSASSRPTTSEMEVYAHIGGPPLGMAFDRDDNLYVCIGGMGLYRVTPDRKVEKAHRRDQPQPVLDQRRQPPAARRRSRHRRRRPHLLLRSDRPLRDARMAGRRAGSARQRPDHLLRPEHRHDAHGAARISKFPNGICIASDGQSILFAETWGCRVKRYWFDGPKAGKVEMVIDNLPGYPDNINLASDGNYWLALVGMRSPRSISPGRCRASASAWRKRVPHRRMAVPEHQHRLRDQVQRARRGARDALGSSRREPSDDHLDARASSGISISAAS